MRYVQQKHVYCQPNNPKFTTMVARMRSQRSGSGSTGPVVVPSENAIPYSGQSRDT